MFGIYGGTFTTTFVPCIINCLPCSSINFRFFIDTEQARPRIKRNMYDFAIIKIYLYLISFVLLNLIIIDIYIYDKFIKR